jgi:hypothetical protein
MIKNMVLDGRTPISTVIAKESVPPREVFTQAGIGKRQFSNGNLNGIRKADSLEEKLKTHEK